MLSRQEERDVLSRLRADCGGESADIGAVLLLWECVRLVASRDEDGDADGRRV